MAAHKRNTASSPTQEPPLTIARVALYARASTCNGQDPEMQLSELREYSSRRGWTITWWLSCARTGFRGRRCVELST